MTSEQWRPNASIAMLKQRADLIQSIRQFFAKRQVMEVQTPVVVQSGVSDPHLDSFTLADSMGYLRTSPEYAMKRLLAADSGDIYELGPVFRQGESGRFHNPEFTMLEWYRVGWNYQSLIDEVIQLLVTCSPKRLALWPVKKMTYTELSQQVFGLDITSADINYLSNIASTHGWHTKPDETTQGVLLDFIFSHLLQPALAQETINVISDFPTCQAALANIHKQDNGTLIAQRFELFLGQLELANGYQELTNADEQQQRFIEDQRQREILGTSPMAADKKFLAAIKHGIPYSAGVALGIDRLLMPLTQSNCLEEVQAFIWKNT